MSYRAYMMMRFLGHSLLPPNQFCERGFAFVKGFGVMLGVYLVICFFGGLEAGFYVWFLFNLFLACDALHAGILALNHCIWNRAVTRDFDKNILVLANAMPYTLQGTSGTAILFIHGFGDTPETWQLIAPRVHSLANATCRAMRLPFTSTPLSQQRHAHLGDWLVAIRDEMASLRRSHKRVFIAGHGLGAGLALLCACENPALADGVIALSPLVHANQPSKILFWLADNFCVSTRVLPNPFRGAVTTADGRVYSYPRDRFIAFAMFRAAYQMTSRLMALPCKDARPKNARPPMPPVLAFVSERDPVIDVPAAMRFLYDADILDEMDVYTGKKAGHVLTLDTGWEKRAARIAAFALR